MVRIKKNELLSKHTSFKIGGPAKYFCETNTLEELKAALKYANKNKLKIFILGAGSNTLISDDGFDGLVIHIKGAAGISLTKFLNYCGKNGFSGLEFLAGIPGSLGGAIYMNAGAYGKTIGEYIQNVHAIDYSCRQFVFSRKQCGFGYRKSIFQKKKLVITGAEFALQKCSSNKIRKLMKSIIKKRTKKQPYDLPSAGSFFKNPEGNYAAALIEGANCKGARVGDAMVSKKHANFIVNAGKAGYDDVIKLKDIVIGKVLDKYKIKLVPEVKFLE